MYRGRLRALVNDETLEALFVMGHSDTHIAETLSGYYEVEISRQNVCYWRKQLNVSTGQFNRAKANREIKKEVKVRKPEQSDWQAEGAVDVDKVHSYIVVIPDLHIPYHHPDAFNFIEDVISKAAVGYTVVNLGDEVDNHAISFHDADPNLDSAGQELARSREALLLLHGIVPEMLLCHSNHGSLHYRRAKAHGIPVEYLRTYREILFPDKGGEQWEWAYSHTLYTPLGQVMFKHQCSGDPRNAAAHEGANLIVGHNHGRFDLSYGASKQRLYWGATAGCLLDRESLAFAYGRETANKPILGCMVIVNGVPFHLPMVLDEDGRWIHRHE
jgi:hypothetical protein